MSLARPRDGFGVDVRHGPNRVLKSKETLETELAAIEESLELEVSKKDLEGIENDLEELEERIEDLIEG